MQYFRRAGFTLVELLVVILIIGALLALLLPALTQPGGRSRSNICKNNLMQMSKTLAVRESITNKYPGYINTLGNLKKKSTRASWAVLSFPYLEQQKAWEQWNAGNDEFHAIEIFVCPSDPPIDIALPHLSYVANAGYIANADGLENRANGVFFDHTRTALGASGPEDERDLANRPLIFMNNAYLQKHDGVSRTLLLTENINALHWGYSTPNDQQKTLDRKYHFGFCWEQPNVVAKLAETDTHQRARRINGDGWQEEVTSFQKMIPVNGFPASNHPGSVNVAFVDGSVRSISTGIDLLVYAQLMTSNHLESDLVDLHGKSEKDLPPPIEGDY